MSMYFHLFSRHRRSGTFMQQFRSHISSSQNSASRFRMNLILFHQVQNSDKLSSSEEPNSLPTPSNYQVLFSHACCFFAAKMRKNKRHGNSQSPEKLVRNVVFISSVCSSWSSSDLLDLRKKWPKSNIISKRKHIVKQTGMEPRVSWMTLCIDKDIYHWNL